MARVDLTGSSGRVDLGGAGDRIDLGGGGSRVNLGGAGTTAFGKVLGFGLSTLEAFPELFGLEADDDVQAYRAQNPVGGFASQFLGTGAFYGIASKGIMAVPSLERVVVGAGSRFTKPWAQTAARWATEAAMIETGRLAVSATPIPEAIFGRERTQPWADMFGGAAVNIAAGGILGGGVGAFKARFANGPKISDFIPEAHPSQPLVGRVRALRDAARATKEDGAPMFPEELRQQFQWEAEKLAKANLMDIQPAYNRSGAARIDGPGVKRGVEVGKVVRPLEGDTVKGRTGELSYTAFLNRVFNYQTKNVGRVGESRLLMVDPAMGFPSQRELDDVVARIGKPLDELAEIGQDHRVFRVNTGQGKPGDPLASDNFSRIGTADKTARAVERRFTDPKGVFKPVANGWWLAREADNGLWIGAKKIKGKVGAPKPGDEWYVARFDTPDALDPQAVAFRDLTINKSAYWPKSQTGEMIGVEAWDALSQFERTFGDVLALPQGVKATTSALKAMGREVAEVFSGYFAPTAGLATMNNKANYAVNMMKFATDFEEALVTNLMEGARALPKNRALFRQIVTLDEPSHGGLADFVKTLGEPDLADVQSALELEIPIKRVEQFAAEGRITPKAAQMLRAMEEISAANVNSFERLRKETTTSSGIALLDTFAPRQGHYGISRQRTGGFHAYIEDARTGELAGYVSGNTQAEARDGAMQVIKDQFEKAGRDLRFGGMSDELLRTADGYDRFVRAVQRPGFLRERGNLLGYDLQKEKLTTEKLVELIQRNVRSRARLMTNITLHEKLWPVLSQLENEAPNIAVQLHKRLKILQGDEGKFAEFQNAAVDKVLGGVLGHNSASKIVRGVQSTLTAFQFGFANIAHPVLNAVSMFQVMFPEAAFVMRTAGTDLSNYVTVPRTDEGGRIVGVVHALSDIKLFGNAFKLLGANERELPEDFKLLLQEMIDQKLVAPSYAEASIGSSGSLIKRMMEGRNINWKDWGQSLAALNEIMVAKSEELNRLMGVSTAYQLGKMLGINEPFRMARFTREFLSKTAFNYTTFDRPTVFTTPIGSLMGTFKTWMFHYMANMIKYAGGGKETLAPLLWQTAATAAVAGGVGTPLFMPMANAASRWFADKSFMDLLYNDVFEDNERAADGVLYGLPGLLGVSLATQAAAPGSDPSRDASMIYSFAAWDRARAFGQMVGTSVETYISTGQSPWEDDKVRNAFARAFAPRTIYRAISAGEGEAIRSLSTGYRVMDNVSLGDALLYAAGFNSVELENTYEAYSQVRKSEEKRRTLVQEYGRALADAWATGDSRMADRVYTRALATGVEIESVLRSASARSERMGQTQLDFALGKDEDAATWDFVTEER